MTRERGGALVVEEATSMGGRLRLIRRIAPGSPDGRAAGAGAGVWLLLGGIVLTCTGVGAIVGIPLIVVGLARPMARRASADAELHAGDDALYEPAPERQRSRGARASAAR